MKKILVPTDFSEHALYAAEVAADIAKRTDARVYLLHIVNIPSYGENDSFAESQNTEEGLFILSLAKKRFKELLAKPFWEGVNVIQALQFDNVYDTVASQAKEHEIDLIVMGSHGTNGWKEDFIGSNTEKVIRLADCPVLTIKHRHEKLELKHILFASNFFGEMDHAFEKVITFAKLFDANLHLLKVITPATFERTPYSRKLMDDIAEKHKLQKYTVNIYNDTSVEAGVRAFGEEIEADLISMTTHGRTGIAHFLSGSITEDVANHVNRPVLSIKIKEEPFEYGVIFPGS